MTRSSATPGAAATPGAGATPAEAARADPPPRPAVWRSLALVALFAVGFTLVAAVVVVRGRVLDDATYTGALERTDAYERVYTEVLADPELAELVEDLLGGLPVAEALDVPGGRALVTSALRWRLPPSTLRRGTEAVLERTLAYVRGDVARLDPDVDVADALAERADAGVAWMAGVLADVPTRAAATLEEYGAAVATYVDALVAGTLPDAVPVLGDGAGGSTTAIADTLLDRLGPDVGVRLREQVVAAVAAGDERDGLVDATGHLVRARLAGAAAELRDALEGRRRLDVVAELADRAGRSRSTVVARLDGVRDATRWFGWPTAAVGALLMAGAATGLVRRHRRDRRAVALALAAAAGASGLAVLALWAVVAAAAAEPLAPAASSGAGSWNLPAGLRSVAADVVDDVAGQLWGTVWWLALVPVAAGVVVAAAVVVAPRLRLPAPSPPVAVGAVAATLAGALVWTVGPPAAAAAQACNGHAELCDRRYDEVVQAATHNAMSSPDVVFIWPEQDLDLREQLDLGVRALLIDTHHWTPFVSDDQLATVDERLPAGLAARLVDTLGPIREARDGAFLCHNHCALGATPLVDALGAVRGFLEENPDEVVTLVVQDAIDPEETADAFAAAGLDRYLHVHEPGRPWATLGDLVDGGERLVVFAEVAGPPPAWYHHAFRYIQDTPYRFASPGELSCDENRGDAEADLFLVNHWVQALAPDRVNAAVVNDHDAIVERAERCRRERGVMPNLIAVDFANIGDVVGAVDTLNGL